MALHQLRAVTARTDVDHLVRLKQTRAAYEALPLLAAHHQGLAGAAPFRTSLVATPRPHVFPLPGDVTRLVDALFTGVDRLFHASDNSVDDVRVAVFAAYGVTAVHPFDNGNGRTAFDFLQLLLMHRHLRDAPPFALPRDAHQRLGALLIEHDLPSTSWEPPALIALAAQLEARLRLTTLEELRRAPALEKVTQTLALVQS